LISTIALTVTGCWKKKYDYAYTSWIVNLTTDTLDIFIGRDRLNTYSEPVLRFTLLPFDTLDGNESRIFGFSANEGINPVQLRFSSSIILPRI